MKKSSIDNTLVSVLAAFAISIELGLGWLKRYVEVENVSAPNVNLLCDCITQKKTCSMKPAARRPSM